MINTKISELNGNIVRTPAGIKVVNIYTPFHLRQCQHLSGELALNDPSVTFFYVGEYLKTDTLKASFPLARFKEVMDPKMNIRNLRNDPLGYLRECRKKIHEIKADVGAFFSAYLPDTPVTVVLFNDKDILSQIIINQCSSRFPQKKIIAVDEGTAFYVNERKTYSAIKNILYRIFSKSMLGERIEHIDRFGTHSKVSIVYLRNISLVHHPRKSIEYRRIQTTAPHEGPTSVAEQQQRGEKKALLLTSCIVESKLLSLERYNSILYTTMEQLLQHGYTVYIKQHPREENDFLRKSNFSSKLHFLERKTTAEEIDYMEYDRIINFGTSVILDAISRDFHSRHIITIDLLNNNRIRHIIDQTFVIRVNSLAEQLDRAL